MKSKNVLYVLTVPAVFLFAFSIRLYWINHKTGINTDEAATHSISSFTKYGWSGPLPENTEITGAQALEMMYGNINDPAKNLAAFETLRKTNNYDLSHPNLYYLLYRLSATVNGSRIFTLKELVKTGCGLNIVLFCFSFLFMYLLLKNLFADRKLIPLGLAAAFLNTGSVSNTLFIRDYQLQETALILFTLFFVIFYKKEKISGWKDFCILAAVTAFTFLSGYFTLLYVGMLGLILTIKQKKNAGFLLAAFTAGTVLTFAAFPAYFDGFSSARAREITDVTIEKTFSEFKYFTRAFVMINSEYLFYIPAAAFLTLCLILSFIKRFKKKSREKIPLAAALIAVALVWSFVTLFFAPYKILRYIMPVFPVISLIAPYIFGRLKDDIYKISAPLFVLVMSAGALFAAQTDQRYYYGDNQFYRKFSAGSYIENGGFDNAERYKFTKKPELPVIFIMNENAYRHVYGYNALALYFMPEQKYLFMAGGKDLAGLYGRYNHFYLVVENNIYHNNFPGPPEGGEILDTFFIDNNGNQYTGLEIANKEKTDNLHF